MVTGAEASTTKVFFMINAEHSIDMPTFMCHQMLSINSSSNEFSFLMILFTIGTLLSVFVCAIPFNSAKRAVIVCVQDSNSNAINTEKCNQKTKFECPICLENILDGEIQAAPCGHLFCAACIERAIAIRNACPLCNLIFSPTHLSRVHLP